jgi:hypothetical protein|tara:strand:- start:452 stop:616 length:165 start_codon:yes stop_codon:yes gene_type:complete
VRNVVLKNITDKADSLAIEYNKTKDPGIRDQWFKLIKTIPLLIKEDNDETIRSV